MQSTSRAGCAVLIRKVGGPEVFEVVNDFPFPPAYPGEILVRMVSTSVNPIDIAVRSGEIGALKAVPAILGGDLAGEVLETYTGSKFAVGDKIFALLPTFMPIPGRLGTYAQYVAVKEEWAAKAPTSLPLADAGAIPLAGLTAWQALTAAAPKPGQRILVLGASGGVGHFAVQFAKAMGLFVVGTASTAHLSIVRRAGADEVFDYTLGPAGLLAAYAPPTPAHTHTPPTPPPPQAAAGPFDIVFDPVGGGWLEAAAACLVREGGAITHVQNPGSDAVANAMHAAAAGDGSGPRWYTTLVQPSCEQLTQIAELVDQGKVGVNVAHRLPLHDAGKGHEIVATGHAGGKVVLLSS